MSRISFEDSLCKEVRSGFRRGKTRVSVHWCPYQRTIKKHEKRWMKTFRDHLDDSAQDNIKIVFGDIKKYYYSKKDYKRLEEEERKLYYNVLLRRYVKLKNHKLALMQVPGLAASIFLGLLSTTSILAPISNNEENGILEYFLTIIGMKWLSDLGMLIATIVVLLVLSFGIIYIVQDVVYNDYDAYIKEKELTLLESLLKKGGILLDDGRFNK